MAQRKILQKMSRELRDTLYSVYIIYTVGLLYTSVCDRRKEIRLKYFIVIFFLCIQFITTMKDLYVIFLTYNGGEKNLLTFIVISYFPLYSYCCSEYEEYDS